MFAKCLADDNRSFNGDESFLPEDDLNALGGRVNVKSVLMEKGKPESPARSSKI